jgi:long-chain acyl-CoA synthetase
MREWRGKTWMYTGDVGYMDDEGYIFLCDRAKDMLIVGGYKVFSVEVEDKLKGLDFIAESAVVGTADEKRPGNDIVNLYIELKPEAKGRDVEQISKEIQEYCRANMAAYKVPKVIRVIDEIPLTPVGKIDKKVLRASAQSKVAERS